MAKFIAHIKQFFHCLWWSVRLQPHHIYEEQETENDVETYRMIGCTCGLKFFESGERENWDQFDKERYTERSKYDH